MTTPAAPSAIGENLTRVRERISAACERARRDPAGVTLIAVSKTWPVVPVVEALQEGVTDFGENRVQEATAKIPQVETAARADDLPSPVWHLIGHLQTNKVREALRTFRHIHSVDSERLLRAISNQGVEPVDAFLEVNVSGEASKFGFAPAELPAMLALARSLHGIRVLGLMTVAPRAADPDDVRPVFRKLAQLAREHALPHLSMGMTEDFEVAIEEGATHIRVGRAIFGDRS